MLKNTIYLFFSIDLPMPQNTSDFYLELCLVQQHKRLGFSTNDWPFYTIN